MIADQPARPGLPASEPLVAEVVDPFGFRIKLPENSWQHVCKYHPEMRGKLEEIKQTLAEPNIIQEDSKYETTYYYYRVQTGAGGRNKPCFVLVCVDRDETNRVGRVKTSHIVVDMKKDGGRILWAKKN